MRILALDYGTKRTGVAVSDPTQTIAQPLDTVPTHQLKEWLRQYCARESVSTIVVGLPMQMSGKPSDTAPAAEALARWAAAEFPAVRVERYDERFTSKLAHRAMLDGGLGKMARRDRALVDRISAAIILQDYMKAMVNG